MTIIDPPADGSDLLHALASLTGQSATNSELILPPSIGQGWLRTFRLSAQLNLMLQQYELNEPITIRRSAASGSGEEVIFSLRDVLPPAEAGASRLTAQRRFLPSAQIASSDLAIEIVVPARRPVTAILIRVSVRLLTDWLGGCGEHAFLRTIVSRSQPYLYDQLLSAELQQASADLFQADVSDELAHFFLGIKAQELIYRVFTELLKREQSSQGYSINTSDVAALYQIRDQVIANLAVPPRLGELARQATMSERKMSRLFRQMFGSSIYEYYQRQRLTEAARLLKQGGWSVSEVGFQLGFVNLSHFAAVFERYHGVTPKKYSALS